MQTPGIYAMQMVCATRGYARYGHARRGNRVTSLFSTPLANEPHRRLLALIGLRTYRDKSPPKIKTLPGYRLLNERAGYKRALWAFREYGK